MTFCQFFEWISNICVVDPPSDISQVSELRRHHISSDSDKTGTKGISIKGPQKDRKNYHPFYF